MTTSYLNFLDTLSDLVCMVNDEGKVQWLNTVAVKNLVSDQNPLLNTTFSSLLKDEAIKRFNKVVEEKSNNKSHTFVAKHNLPDSRYIELNWTFIYNTDQNVMYGTAKNPFDSEVQMQTYYLDKLERTIMEQAVDPCAALYSILNNYIKGLEDIFPALKASILKIEKNKVWHLASSSLPKEFTTAINGEAIGPNTGSCGTAAYTKKRIIVSDINTNPLWEGYKEYALPLGLKACWSQPIFNAQKEVVATFANYYGSVRTPSEKELKVFERSASLVGIIIEHFQKKSDLESNSELYSYVNLATNDAIYDWDLLEDHIKWGESFSRLFGHTLTEETYPLSKWELLVHPKDLKENLSSLQACLDNPSRSRWKARYRFKKADNTYAQVEEKGYIVRNEKGKPVRMIGVLSDIYETWLAEQKKEVIKIFSHIFNKSLPLKKTLEEFTQIPLTHTIFSVSEIWLTNTNRNEINCIAVKSEAEAERFYALAKETIKLPFGKGLPGVVAQTQSPIFWNSTDGNTNFTREKAAIQAGINNIVVLPIFNSTNTVGVWLLGTKNKIIDEITIQRLWEEVNPFISGEIIRKQVEDELTRLIELAPDIICMLDSKGNFKRINATGCTLLEYAEKEIIDHNFRKFIHLKDQEKFKDHIDQLVKNNTTLQLQSRFITKSNQTIYLDWTSAVTADKEFIYAVAKNTTEQKKLQNLLDDATEMARIGTWELNLNKKTIFWSAITQSIHEAPTGYSPKLEEGIRFYRQDYQKRIKEAVSNAINKGEAWDYEMPIITMKGNERWVRTMGEAEFKHGKCVKLYGSFQDIHKRKVAELNVTKTLSEKNEILERIGDAFFAVDKNWIVTYVNHLAEKLIRKKKADMIGNKLWDVFGSNIKHPTYKHYHRAMRTGETIHFEDYYTPVNKWFEVTIYPSSTGLSVYCLDITERKLAEKETKKSNERFKKVAKATNDAIWDWNIIEDTQYRGEGFKTLFGHDVNSIDPKEFSWVEHLHPEDRIEAEKSLNTAIKDPNIDNWSHEYRYRKANDEYAYVIDRGVIIRNHKGKALRMVGAMTDITHRIQYQKSLTKLNNHLQESQKKYMDLFHLSPIPMWLYDIDTYKFLDVNDAAVKHYGYSKEEFLSLTILDIRPKDEINRVKKSVQNVKNHKKSTFETVFKHLKKNGETIYVEVRGNEMEYNGKRAEVILALDITEKLAYIEAIESQNKRLKQIAWDQSHLVRAPLSRLMGVIDLINNGNLNVDEKEEFLTDILEAAKEMDATIKEISDKTTSN